MHQLYCMWILLGKWRYLLIVTNFFLDLPKNTGGSQVAFEEEPVPYKINRRYFQIIVVKFVKNSTNLIVSLVPLLTGTIKLPSHISELYFF